VKDLATELVGYYTCAAPGQGNCSLGGFSPGRALFSWDWSDNFPVDLAALIARLAT
jgi:hypothetical protein